MLEPKNPNGDPLRKPPQTDTEKKSDPSKSGSQEKKS
jgi:hypothetical protein